ncbi:MAG: flagellar basal body-associated FliL family protein [Parvularculaceae bacterium]
MSVALEAGSLGRVRVRTPGKHIAAFAGAALIMIAGTVYLARPQSDRDEAPRVAALSAPAKGGGSLALPEFLVDLAPDAAGRAAYMRLAVSIEADAAAASVIERRLSEIRERIAFLLRGLSADDLKGEEGMRLLKSEILRRVNLVIAPETAGEAVITDIIVQ